MLDGYPVDINRQLVNPIGHDHEKVMCEVTIGDDTVSYTHLRAHET